MLLGVVPAPQLLQQYSLPHYVPIVEAMRSGSVRQLNESLDTNQHRFIMQVSR